MMDTLFWIAVFTVPIAVLVVMGVTAIRAKRNGSSMWGILLKSLMAGVVATLIAAGVSITGLMIMWGMGI